MESTHNQLIEETTQLNHNITVLSSAAAMLQKNYSAVINQVNELLMQNQNMKSQLEEKEKEVTNLMSKLEDAENALKNMTSEAIPVSEGSVMDY